MKKIKFLLFFLVLITASRTFAQNQFEVLKDNDGTKMLKGLISVDILEKDTAFSWYATGKKFYTPDPAAINALKKNADSIQLVVFMGTWCEDSHFVIPKLFVLVEAAGFPKDRISLIAADRNKKTLSHLAEAFNLENVPTIVVMKKGKEIGRVVEYGKSGLYDKELAGILGF